jgi:hypothetical protein
LLAHAIEPAKNGAGILADAITQGIAASYAPFGDTPEYSAQTKRSYLDHLVKQLS